MKNRIPFHLTFSTCLIMLFCILSCKAQVENESEISAIKLIYDGDIGPDACDFSTISMLHEYHNKGFIELLAVIGATPDLYHASTFSIYNQIYGNEIPIAGYNPESSDVDFDEGLIKKYDEAIKEHTNADENKTIYEKYGNGKTLRSNGVTGTVTLYRKLLSEAEDNSIVIYAAGQLFNFPPLLKSGSDQYSPLSGKELLKAKLRKVVIMGGRFPESKTIGNPIGAEWNWWAFGSKNITKMTMNALVETGKPIIYVGFEVGVQVHVGMEMIKRLGREHPTTEAFYLSKATRNPTKNTINESSFLTSENPAFDEIGLFVAVEGGIGEFFNTIQGRVEINEHGGNSWVRDEQGNESYITLLPDVEKKLSEIITDRITGDF